jgi:hypothetical protein
LTSKQLSANLVKPKERKQMSHDLKEDVLLLAGFIARIAEAEADLEVPTETAEHALEQAMPIVAELAGEDSDEYAILNEAHIRIGKVLQEMVF